MDPTSDSGVQLSTRGTLPVSGEVPLRLTLQQHERLARKYRIRRWIVGYAFIAPILFFFALFMIVPIVWVVYGSFHQGGIITPSEFVGPDNWRSVFGDDLVRTTVRNTGLFALLAIPGVIVVGLVLALALLRIQRGEPVFRAGIFFPVLAPPVIGALMFLFVLHRDFGAVTLAMRLVGLSSPSWLGDPAYALPTIAAFEIWRGAGFYALVFLAGLLALPKELYHAAALDGANAARRFWHLTLPLLKPTIQFVLVMATIWNLQLFDSVFVLTNGGPVNTTVTVVMYVYRSLFAFGNVGFGYALSVILLVVILALSLIQFRLLRSRR